MWEGAKLAMNTLFCWKIRVRKALSRHLTRWSDSMEQGCSEKHSKASLAIMVPNFLISNPWRSRYSIRPTEPNFITLIHFHHLNEEATRMQTVSSGAYYPRKQLSIRLLKTISTVWPNGWTVIHVVSSTDNLHAQRHASKTFILSNLPLNQKKKLLLSHLVLQFSGACVR